MKLLSIFIGMYTLTTTQTHIFLQKSLVHNMNIKVKLVAIDDHFPVHGTQKEIRNIC